MSICIQVFVEDVDPNQAFDIDALLAPKVLARASNAVRAQLISCDFTIGDNMKAVEYVTACTPLVYHSCQRLKATRRLHLQWEGKFGGAGAAAGVPRQKWQSR